MEFVIPRQEFLKILGHMQSIVDRKTAFPILSNVKIEATDKLTMTAATIDFELIESCKADIVQSGSITVNATLLHDIVKKMPDDSEITLKLVKEHIKISASNCKSEFNLPTLSVESFPTMTGAKLDFNFSIPTEELIVMINKTKFAMDFQDIHYDLNGIYLHVVKENGQHLLRAVATDSMCLALKQQEVSSVNESMPGVIIPRKVVMELVKLLEGTKEKDIKIEVSDVKIRLTIGEAIMTSKLIDGTFPNYQTIIPKNNDKELIVDKLAISQAVDRVSVITMDKIRTVLMKISTDKIIVSASDRGVTQGTEEVKAKFSSEETLEVSFNVRQLMDILSEISGEDVKFSLLGSLNAVLVQEIEDNSSLYITMPVRRADI
ncbi:MAG: DNA polymerase III subunit beta [Alphaproteobacteria bacterium]|nr:DNA polymerase III subunit beta [Alphaproteobacteria bacterium]MBL0717966.1 DNA polymerase III subunit beta [Alphaproteobacteria bacterium]